MTTKKPKAPASPIKGNKTAKPSQGGKKTTNPKPAPKGGKKPFLSQQKRLKALSDARVAPPAPAGLVEAPKSLPEPLKTFRDLRDEHEKALEKRIPYPEPLGAIVEFKPYPSDLHASGTLVETGPLVQGLYPAQKRDKKLLYAAIGVVALGEVVYYGGWL